MEIEKFIEDLGEYLEISGRVVEREGGKIDVGEEFTLRITVRNKGRSWYPFIYFRSVAVFVNRGAHARPARNAGGRLNIDSYLSPGESGSVDIRMVATSELSWWDDLWNAEELASVSVVGRLDYERFFQARNSARIRIDF